MTFLALAFFVGVAGFTLTTGQPHKDILKYSKTGDGIVPIWVEVVLALGWFIYWPVKLYRLLRS